MNYLQNQRGTGATLEANLGDTIKAACSASYPIEWDAEIEGIVVDLDPLTIEDRNGYMPMYRRVDHVVSIVRRA